MRNYCNIIKDMLPLYLEELVSEDTASFINEHLDNCEQCRTESETMKHTYDIIAIEKNKNTYSDEALPIKNIKKKLIKRRAITIMVSVLLTLTILFLSTFMKSTLIDYGSSDVYSQTDMDAAIELIKDKFSTWDGCKLYSIEYTSDELCERELEYCNSLADDGVIYTECIIFRTEFRSPIFPSDSWNTNFEYNWSWYLARTENGAWELLTWGTP